VLVFLLLVLSAYLRLRAMGLACAQGPAACAGQPPPASPLWAAVLHRLAASLLGILILTIGLRAWRRGGPRERAVAAALLALTAALAVLGLKTPAPTLPWVTLGNVAGAMLMLALLVSQISPRPAVRVSAAARPAAAAGWRFHRSAALIGVILLFAQISLGAWLSANAAAAACPALPGCGVAWWKHASWQAFDLTRRLVSDSGALQPPADAPFLHMLHRLGALLVFLYLGTLGLLLAIRHRQTVRRASLVLLGLLVLQGSLGLALLALGLPLGLAVAHNAAAALLLAAAVKVVLSLGKTASA
jgi:cytochrome c oxidase assembly protein subunit 15